MRVVIPSSPSSPSSRSSRSAPSTRADVGQAATLVLLVCAALLVVVASALAAMGGDAADRVRARTAADAAALASVDGGRVAAVRFADLHGATVESWRRGPGPRTVTVTVRVGDVVATARATAEEGAPARGGAEQE